MNREEFLKKFETAEPMSSEEGLEIIGASLKRCSWQIKAMIIMEELAELSKEVSKSARHEQFDTIGLIEEIADVQICIEMLIERFGLDDETVEKAIAVKLEREKERIFDYAKEAKNEVQYL